MPGMWCLARLRCPNGHGEFYGVLAEGHGLYAPALIELDSCRLVKKESNRWAAWFADWLKDAYSNRQWREIPDQSTKGAKVEAIACQLFGFMLWTLCAKVAERPALSGLLPGSTM